MDGRSIIYFQVAQAISSFYVRQVCQYNFNIPRIPSSLSLSLSLWMIYARLAEACISCIYARRVSCYEEDREHKSILMGGLRW